MPTTDPSLSCHRARQSFSKTDKLLKTFFSGSFSASYGQMGRAPRPPRTPSAAGYG